MGAGRAGSATRLTQPSCGLGRRGLCTTSARLGRWGRGVRGKVGSVAGADLVTSLRQAGVRRGELVALVIFPALELGLAAGSSSWTVRSAAAEIGRADEELRPRWVLWSGQTAARLAEAGVRLATCWDIAARS